MAFGGSGRGGTGGGRSRRRLLLAWLAALAALGPARADEAVRAILFGSLDAGPSAFLSAGVKAAPDRVDREGFAGLATVGAGARVERGTLAAPALVRTTVLAAALGGYQFFSDRGVVGLFAGPETAFEALYGGGQARMLPARFGLRLQGEAWLRPTETTLATATLVLGSARFDAYGRFSWGTRFLGAYLGPEAAAYADRTAYRKVQLGLHATDFAYGRLSFRLSGGCAYEPETGRLGPYLSLAAWTPL